jgi:hypothetical protein
MVGEGTRTVIQQLICEVLRIHTTVQLKNVK